MARERKVLVIMRGPSGSGKSTYTSKHLEEGVVCSADNYFSRGGEYKFDPRQLGAAHGYCKGKCETELKKGTPLVVVDNTNTQLLEMKPYVKLAREHGYDVRFVRLDTPVSVAAARNTHGVPEQAVQRMAARMDDIPDEWGRETVVSGIE